jgi:hypothetical protein
LIANIQPPPQATKNTIKSQTCKNILFPFGNPRRNGMYNVLKWKHKHCGMHIYNKTLEGGDCEFDP